MRELLLNLGRPTEAQHWMLPTPTGFPVDADPLFRVVEALDWQGDSAIAHAAIERRRSAIAAAAAEASRPLSWYYDVCARGLWGARQGDLASARQSATALDDPRYPIANPRVAFVPICRAILIAEIAVAADPRTAGGPVAALDSLMATGPVTNPYIRFAAIAAIARLWRRLGEPVRGLAAARRRPLLLSSHGVEGLSTLLSVEGRLALAVGDTVGARRALTHWLALRSAPEPSLRPERDSVRALLAAIAPAR